VAESARLGLNKYKVQNLKICFKRSRVGVSLLAFLFVGVFFLVLKLIPRCLEISFLLELYKLECVSFFFFF